MAQTDIRVMVPRVRRALEGVGAAAVLTDDEIKDLIADAIADIILYTGGVFGKELVVTGRVGADEDDPAAPPDEYATSEELTLAEQSVVAAQAALNHFFHHFVNLKVSERIGDEAQEWSYSLSANLLVEQFKYLIRARDDAIGQIEADGAALDAYVSFLAVRDAYTAALVEPWVSGHLPSGQEDYRFGTLG